jgi:hypothetical protein
VLADEVVALPGIDAGRDDDEYIALSSGAGRMPALNSALRNASMFSVGEPARRVGRGDHV